LTQVNAIPDKNAYIIEMDHQFCPGAKLLRQPKPEIFECPSCGEEVEIWTDEIRGVCSNCGRTMFREGTMSCLEWCKFAQECVGEAAYDRYMQNRAVGLRRRLLEAMHRQWKQDADRLRQAEAVLSWSEEILKEEKADWHIVIPASILQNVDGGTSSDAFRAAEQLLVRSGLTPEDLERIRRIVEDDPSEDRAEFDVVNDARLLSRPGKQSAEALRTGTAIKLAGALQAEG
jgi:predicted RNA-binding Zn-ribbon protein involved in translation (DUF1610 family)